MEISQRLGDRVGLLCFIFSVVLLVGSCKAENKTDPTDNVNLTPFWGWRSAYYCLKKVPNPCPKKYIIGLDGWLNVTKEDGDNFCKRGCADHTREVLKCIHYVKRDFWFGNKATVKHINDTIENGCMTPQGFNGTSFYPTSGYEKISASVTLIISTLIFISLLSI